MHTKFDNLILKYFKFSTTNKKGRRFLLKIRNGCSKLIINGTNTKAHRFFKKDK